MPVPSDAVHARFDQARADVTARFNETVAEPARLYMEALRHLLEVEERFVLDPSNRDLTEESRAARQTYDEARARFVGTRSSALGARTTAIAGAWAEVEGGG